MAKFTKYYVVEKVTYRESGRTDRISFCPFDGIIEFATREAVEDVLKKRFDLYESKQWGNNRKWNGDGFSYNNNMGYRYDYKIMSI